MARTFEQLWDDATNRRWVRWSPSGAIEKLRLDKKKRVVLANGPFVTYHYVATPKHPDRVFNYELINPAIKIPLEVLRAAAMLTRHFLGESKKSKKKDRAKA
jgi:hypothetical protein